MDYDNWLQKGAGAFDDGPDDDQIWSYYGDEMFNDWSENNQTFKQYMYETGEDELFDPISDGIWNALPDYVKDDKDIDDDYKMYEKYPEEVEKAFSLVKPKNPEEYKHMVWNKGKGRMNYESLAEKYWQRHN